MIPKETAQDRIDRNATAAMKGIVENLSPVVIAAQHQPKVIAGISYEIAAAMERERDKVKGENKVEPYSYF